MILTGRTAGERGVGGRQRLVEVGAGTDIAGRELTSFGDDQTFSCLFEVQFAAVVGVDGRRDEVLGSRPGAEVDH